MCVFKMPTFISSSAMSGEISIHLCKHSLASARLPSRKNWAAFFLCRSLFLKSHNHWSAYRTDWKKKTKPSRQVLAFITLRRLLKYAGTQLLKRSQVSNFKQSTMRHHYNADTIIMRSPCGSQILFQYTVWENISRWSRYTQCKLS